MIFGRGTFLTYLLSEHFVESKTIIERFAVGPLFFKRDVIFPIEWGAAILI